MSSKYYIILLSVRSQFVTIDSDWNLGVAVVDFSVRSEVFQRDMAEFFIIVETDSVCD